MRRKRPRILVVTPTQTHPSLQGNSARILAFGREMKRRGFLVDVLYYVIDHWNEEIARDMRQEWAELHLVSARPHRRQSHASHWGLDDWCPDELVHKVRALCETHAYSAVVVNYVWLSRVLEAVENGLRVIDTHDIFGGRAQLALEAGMEPNWFFTSEAEEGTGLDRADLIFAIQKEERGVLATRTSRPVWTVGHPVHATYRPSPAEEKTVFGYFASGNPWNRASIRVLDHHLAQSRERLAWVLAGSICKADLGLRSCPHVLGMVPAPSDFYDRVHCVLNPMLAGTGLKIKTVEALAHGRPVIGTDEAYRGLETFHPLQQLLTIDDMATAMHDYAASATLRRELSAACGRTYVSYMAETQQAYDDFASFIR